MAYALSFADSFYQVEGDDSLSLDDMEGRNPVTVYQALVALSDDVWNEMVRDIFQCDPDYVDINTVLLKVQEHDTCDGFESPVYVYINDDYGVEVYDE